MWIYIVLVVPLLLTEVALFHFSVPVPLTRVAPRGLKCPSAALCGCSVSFQVSHQCSLWWLCLLPGFPLLIPVVDPCHTRCPMPLLLLALHHSTWFTAAHLGGPASSQLPHCCSLGWLHITQGVSLPLTFVAKHHFMCFTSAHWGVGSVLFHVSHCCSLS